MFGWEEGERRCEINDDGEHSNKRGCSKRERDRSEGRRRDCDNEGLIDDVQDSEDETGSMGSELKAGGKSDERDLL